MQKNDFEMEELYSETASRLEKVDFETVWPGFHPCPFALYDRRETVLDDRRFKTPENFYGNTCIFYGGRQIAIWNIELDPPEDPDIFASCMVHEMFHAFQQEKGEMRFPDDLKLLTEKIEIKALSLKIAERQLLADGNFFGFCAARSARRKISSTHEEEMIETAEGMAQFAEFRALGQLSPALLEEKLKLCRARLKSPEGAAKLRLSGYDSGMYMLWLAVDLGMGIYHFVGRETKSVFEILAEQVKAAKATPPDEELLAAAAAIIQEHQNLQNAELEEFYKAARRKEEGPFVICGYDPMNFWRQGDILFSRSFVSLHAPGGEVKNIYGKALFNMKSGSSNAVLNYLV